MIESLAFCHSKVYAKSEQVGSWYVITETTMAHSSLWYRVSPAVSGGHRDRVLSPRLLNDPQHLVLTLKIKPIATLGFH